MYFSPTYIYCLYHPQDDGIVMFNQIAETFDKILTEYLSASFDFSINHKEVLVHSDKTDKNGHFCCLQTDTDH